MKRRRRRILVRVIDVQFDCVWMDSKSQTHHQNVRNENEICVLQLWNHFHFLWFHPLHEVLVIVFVLFVEQKKHFKSKFKRVENWSWEKNNELDTSSLWLFESGHEVDTLWKGWLTKERMLQRFLCCDTLSWIVSQHPVVNFSSQTITRTHSHTLTKTLFEDETRQRRECRKFIPIEKVKTWTTEIWKLVFEIVVGLYWKCNSFSTWKIIETGPKNITK